jgi:hypothetical protein
MSKLYVGFFVIASMLVLSGFGFLGLVLMTNLIWWFNALINMVDLTPAGRLARLVCFAAFAFLGVLVLLISMKCLKISYKCFHGFQRVVMTCQ